MEELFNDRLARYSFAYRSRTTTKEKERFLKALVTDIAQVRKDVSVIEYGNAKKANAQNVYVGDLKKANKIICTYYDTPAVSIGDYVLFDRKKQEKQTNIAVLSTMALWLLLGAVGTLLYMKHAADTFTLLSAQTILIALVYGIYFYVLSRVTKGAWNRKTLVRNTSSILCMLQLLTETKKQSKTAYAFLDDGCYGDRGLEVLRSSVKKNAQIYFLDCVGADADLYAVGPQFGEGQTEAQDIHCVHAEQEVNYIFCAEQNHEQEYYLTKGLLHKKSLNLDHLNRVIELLKY